jgi:RNA polymerase sigma-70 factor, ECF subfamily
VVYTDSGGKVPAARAPIRGADRVARYFLGTLKKFPQNMEVRRVRVNGQPGVITLVAGHVENVLTLDVVDGRIATLFVIRNPDKLERIDRYV